MGDDEYITSTVTLRGGPLDGKQRQVRSRLGYGPPKFMRFVSDPPETVDNNSVLSHLYRSVLRRHRAPAGWDEWYEWEHVPEGRATE